MRARRLTLVVLIALCASGSSFALEGGLALAAGAPRIGHEWAERVGITTARLAAKVNPSEADTRYHFEYGASTSYGSSVPVPDSDIGEGAADVIFGQSFGGLQAGTTYHYRIVATSAEGTSDGPDQTFTTFAGEAQVADTCPNALVRSAQFSSYLPDCRAYELVSPAHKSDANVEAEPTLTQSAPSGDAIKYDSLTAFGDPQGIQTTGEEYIAQRGAEGWSNSPITPFQGGAPLSVFTSQQYVALSEDLSKGIYLARTPIGEGHPNVSNVTNLYLRTNLLSGSVGNYELLDEASSELPSPGFQITYPIAFGGASKDFSHLIFETEYDLTPEASGLSTSAAKVYEWFKGTVRLVGILPNGEPAEESIVGGGAGVGGGPFSGVLRSRHWAPNAISQDGSRVIFTGPPFGATGQYETLTGNLYMRFDGVETVQLNVSERSEPDPSGPQPARFWGATPDGSKVFFTTTGLLTDNAVNDGVPLGSNLYEYDVDAPQGRHLTLISVDNEPHEINSVEGGVGRIGNARGSAAVAVTADGSYVYFVGYNRLVPGQPARSDIDETDLYVWHDGTVRFIAAHSGSNDAFGSHPIRYGWGEEGGVFGGDMFRMTPDGKTVAFASADVGTARRAGYDNSDPRANGRNGSVCREGYEEDYRGEEYVVCREIFVYNYDSDRLVCASCNSTGAMPAGEASFATRAFEYPVNEQSQFYLSRPLSGDGRDVFFDTGDALVAQDTNNRRDVYEFDTFTGQVHLVSSGVCDCDSFFVDASASGRDVFFVTSQRLVREDIDSNADMYDARVEGGIARQNEAPPAVCEGDDCQGPAKGASAFSLPASSTFNGVGNAPLPVEAKKKSKPKKKVKHKRKGKPKKGKRRGHKSRSGKRTTGRAGR